MKKIYFLLFLLSSIGTSAQKYVPFPTKNASWNILRIVNSDSNVKPDSTLLQYSLQGDTTINGTVYHKVSKNVGSVQYPLYIGVGGFREQDKKLYYIGGNYSFNDDYSAEVLLYDFNKQVGDTLWLNKYEKNYIIKDIDSIKIGTEFRKRYTVESGFIHNPSYIIEGIGNISDGPLGILTPIPTCICHFEYDFICFSQNGETVYLNPSFIDCNSTLKTGFSETKINEQHVKVHPSLVKDYVTFQFDYPDKKYSSIELLDCSGQHLVTVPISNSPEFKLNMSAYSAGIYLVLVRGLNTIESHKIFKL